MGYYTTLSIYLEILEGKADELQALLTKLGNEAKDDPQHWFEQYDDIYLSNVEQLDFGEYDRRNWGWMSVKKDGHWDTENTENKLYDAIAPFIKGFIEGDGEESDDLWRICFNGKGQWKRKHAIFVFEDRVREVSIMLDELDREFYGEEENDRT